MFAEFDDIFDAIAKGNTKLVREFLDAGEDPDLQDDRGYSIAYHAAKAGNLDVFKIIMDAGANMYFGHATIGYTALHVQATYDIVTLVIKKYPELIFVQDEHGFTPLHWYALWGRMDVVELLVECGAHINMRATADVTPFDRAMSRGHRDIMKYLKKRGGVPGTEIAAIEGNMTVKEFRGTTSERELAEDIWFCQVENGRCVLCRIDEEGNMQDPMHLTSDMKIREAVRHYQERHHMQ
jgi:ankyrin repeat protein